VLVALVALLALGGLTSCRAPLTLAALHHRVHATSLSSFRSWWVGEQAALQRVSPATIERWLASAPGRLDDADARRGPWDLSTDRCSFAPDAGPTFDFRWPCIRHDLAWRNLARLQRQRTGPIDTHARRVRATERFLADMRETCAARSGPARTSCRAVAATYHRAVLLLS
jgi:hypothetical protein